MTNEEILEAIGNLTVLELSELVKAAEEKFGVSAAAPVAVAAAGAPAAGAPAARDGRDPRVSRGLCACRLAPAVLRGGVPRLPRDF